MSNGSARVLGHLMAEVVDGRAAMSRAKPKSDTLPPRVVALLAGAQAPLSAGKVARALRVSTPTAAVVLKAMGETGAVMVGRTEGGQNRYSVPTPEAGQGDNALRATALKARGWAID